MYKGSLSMVKSFNLQDNFIYIWNPTGGRSLEKFFFTENWFHLGNSILWMYLIQEIVRTSNALPTTISTGFCIKIEIFNACQRMSYQALYNDHVYTKKTILKIDALSVIPSYDTIKTYTLPTFFCVSSF